LIRKKQDKNSNSKERTERKEKGVIATTSAAWREANQRVGWAKAVKPCPPYQNKNQIPVGTLRFAHPTIRASREANLRPPSAATSFEKEAFRAE
jgi:hypothetical protein